MQRATVWFREGTTAAEFADTLRTALLHNKLVVTKGLDASREQRPFWDDVTERAGEVISLGERPSGEKTGEKWLEIRYDPAIKNAYRHANIAQPMHTDGSYLSNAPDVVFFYCLHQASSGGETTFFDSEALIDLLSKSDKPLLRDLMTTAVKFSKVDDHKTRKIIDEDNLGPVLNWNYYCIDPASPPEHKALAERFHDFLETRVVGENQALPVRLEPGHAVFFHDERLIHGRNAFDAKLANDRFFWKTAFRLRY